jgi:type IV pilus assembly protein PilE
MTLPYQHTIDNLITMKIAGFTLLELIACLAIISILLGVCYPSYTFYIKRSQRVEAAAKLAQIASALEAYALTNNGYAGANLADLGFSNDLSSAYQISIQLADESHFILQASPVQPNSECGNLILNDLGEKKITGKNNINSCW